MSVRGDIPDIGIALWFPPLAGKDAGAGKERQGGHGDCSSALFGRVCAEACCALEGVLWLERCEHSDLAARRRGDLCLAAGQIGLALVLVLVLASVLALVLGPAVDLVSASRQQSLWE